MYRHALASNMIEDCEVRRNYSPPSKQIFYFVIATASIHLLHAKSGWTVGKDPERSLTFGLMGHWKEFFRIHLVCLRVGVEKRSPRVDEPGSTDTYGA